MADIADRASKITDDEIERLVNSRVRYVGESAEFCHECEEMIPQARREAIPGVTLCVPCQEWSDKRNRR